MNSDHNDNKMMTVNGDMTTLAGFDSENVALDQGGLPVRRFPGQAAMWFFVIGDLWIFACYFACYVFDRGQSPDLFLLGQYSLNLGLGAFNTILLLTSSLLVALCVEAVRANTVARARYLLLLGGGCGVVFLMVKALEWYGKISTGLPAGAGEYFLYYFMFTGLHFLHVSLGLVILTLVYRELTHAKQPQVDFVESGAIYWHLVDLLWIIIFALLYLMR